MKRILMMVIRNLWLVPLYWCRLCYHAAHADRYTLEEHFRLFRKIVFYANRGGRVLVKGYGVEKLPEKDGFVFFPNHQGMYDALAIIAVCPRTFSIVVKKEVENIQFLKQIFACIRAKFIIRDDVRQSMHVIQEVTEEVKQGKNFIIFPEGTRSRKGNELLDFKGGSFRSAVRAKCPIVPVALINSFLPFDSNSIQPVTVQVHFLDPIPYEEYQSMKTTEIAAMVKARIEEVIKNYKNS